MSGSRPGRKPDTPAGGGEDTRKKAERAKKIAHLLIAEYPDARCMLDHKDPFQLLVATILAAQCTDERVNMVTPSLFARFPTPQSMAQADLAELEALVRSTGFFHNKAKSIRGAAETLARNFPDRFPDRMEDLLTLPGVGRKTANVVLGTCFGVPSIVVDTHVRRVAQRLGLASSEDPDEIERELHALIPEKDWTAFSHAVTFHGRRCCAARKPDHQSCAVRALCDSRDI
jgi:endonuclease-3